MLDASQPGGHPLGALKSYESTAGKQQPSRFPCNISLLGGGNDEMRTRRHTQMSKSIRRGGDFISCYQWPLFGRSLAGCRTVRCFFRILNIADYARAHVRVIFRFLVFFPFLFGAVIRDGPVKGICAKIGAMVLLFRETGQGIDHRFLRDLHGFFERLAFGHFANHTRNGNGGAATKGLKFHIFQNIIFDLYVKGHDVAAYRIAHFPYAIHVRYYPDIARVPEVIHNDFVIHCLTPYEIRLPCHPVFLNNFFNRIHASTCSVFPIPINCDETPCVDFSSPP